MRMASIAALRWFLCSSLLFAAASSRVEAQPQPYSADEIKAAFIYRFGTYIEWPSTTPADKPITIAVLGAPSIATELEEYLPGRTIEGHPIKLRRIEQIQDARDAQLVFIGEQHDSVLRKLIGALGDRPVLVVTDVADGLESGAMVNFRIVDQRVRFEISLRKAQDAGLMLSSRLLSAAIRVVTSGCWYGCGDPKPAPELVQTPRNEPAGV